jgi:hypothetical protein
MAHNGGQTNQSEKNKQRKDTRVELMGCIEQRESRGKPLSDLFRRRRQRDQACRVALIWAGNTPVTRRCRVSIPDRI